MSDDDSDPVQRSEEIGPDLFLLASLGVSDDDHVLVGGLLAPWLFIPLHRHRDIECLHVSTGSIDVYLEDRGRWITLRSGESSLIKSGVAHAIRNVTDRPASTLAVVTVRLARFLRELDEVAKIEGRERTCEQRMRSLRELAERYGYWNAPTEQSEAIRALPASVA